MQEDNYFSLITIYHENQPVKIYKGFAETCNLTEGYIVQSEHEMLCIYSAHIDWEMAIYKAKVSNVEIYTGK